VISLFLKLIHHEDTKNTKKNISFCFRILQLWSVCCKSDRHQIFLIRVNQSNPCHPCSIF